MSIDLGYTITAKPKNMIKVIGGDINVSFPTIEFDVKKSLLNSIYKLGLSIYGLSDEKVDGQNSIQTDLYKDILDYNGEYEIEIQVIAKNAIFTLFDGYVKECYSIKQNGLIWTTNFMCTNYGWSVTDGMASVSLSSNATLFDLTKELAKKIQGITLKPTNIPSELSTQLISSRGINMTGNALEILRERLSDYQISIDKKQLNLLKKSDLIINNISNADAIPSLSSKNSTLRKQNNYYICQSYFRPDINDLGMVIDVENNIYRVMGIQHTGIISPTVSNECFSSFELFKL